MDWLIFLRHPLDKCPCCTLRCRCYSTTCRTNTVKRSCLHI